MGIYVRKEYQTDFMDHGMVSATIREEVLKDSQYAHDISLLMKLTRGVFEGSFGFPTQTILAVL